MMRHSQRNLFLLIVILICLASSAFSGAGAFQSSGQTTQSPPSKAAQDQDPVPVPITAREKPATRSTASTDVTPEQFANFGFPSINNKGEIAFLAYFPDPAKAQTYGHAIFVRMPDGTWRVSYVKEKTLNDNWVMTGYSTPTIADNGDLAFSGNFGEPNAAPSGDAHLNPASSSEKPSVNAGIFIKTAAGIKNVTQLGDEVPRMPSKFTGFSQPTLNSKGAMAFIGTYGDPDGRGLFIYDKGKLTLVVRSGQKIAPNDTAVFSEHYYPSRINERGEVAWYSRIGGAVGGGIFVNRATGVEAIALQTKPSPIKGANYIGFGQIPPGINDKGDVAFVGFYDGPNNGRALFVKEGNAPVKVVAKSGDNIPGTTSNFTSFDKPVINNRGEIAFIGSYGGRMRGIFLKTAKGIETIAMTDQKAPGAGKEDTFNNFTPPTINDRGEVVFYAQLKNSTVGIFIKDATGFHPLVMRGDKLPTTK